MRTTLTPLLIVLAGCTVQPAHSAPPSPAGGPMRTGWEAPTRSEEECRPLLDSIAADPAGFEIPVPQLASLRVPPPDDVPAELRGVTVAVRIRVDRSGAVIQDSTTFHPEVINRRYARRLREVIAGWRYRPAVLHGCAVPSWGRTDLTLAQRR